MAGNENSTEEAITIAGYITRNIYKIYYKNIYYKNNPYVVYAQKYWYHTTMLYQTITT